MKKEKRKNSKLSLNNALDFLTELITTTIKKLNKFLTLKKTSPIVKAVIRVLVSLIILVILEIPFFVVEKLGVGLIHLFTETCSEVITTVWVSLINYSYLIFALIILFKVINDMSKRKEYNIEIKNDNSKKVTLYTTVCNVLKVIIGISLIPLMLMALLLFGVLGMLICLITHKIFIIGPFFIVIGLIIMVCTSLSYIYDIVFFDKGGNK